jgi:hypothetical protein
MIRKLISAWMLTLVGSLLLPLLSVAAVAGTTYDTAGTTTTTAATIAQHATAVEAVSRGETSLRSMASGRARFRLGSIRNLDAPRSEVVQRWMSKAELEATQKTGLMRGGREGTHYVTDAVNRSARRARLRTSLPQTPEVRVTMEVPAGKFSPPTKVKPDFGMPGGGLERTATGEIPVKILRVDGKP